MPRPPITLLRSLAERVQHLNLHCDDDPYGASTVHELCEVALKCAEIEERRSVDEVGEPPGSSLLLTSFQQLDERHGNAKEIPEIERLVYNSKKADRQFVAGIYAALAALEEARDADRVDDRVRRERAAEKVSTSNEVPGTE